MGQNLLPGLGENNENFADLEFDFSHQDFHRRQVVLNTQLLAAYCGLSKPEIALAQTAAFFHDLGYGFIAGGHLPPNLHHLGSILRAYRLFDPADFRDFGREMAFEDIARAVILHIEDVLPEGTPLWMRIVRDADRIAGIGPTGLIRAAYYEGFTHPAFTERTPREVVQDGIICDLRAPWVNGNDERPDQFCREVVLPWIIENGKVTVVLEKIIELINRINGKKDPEGKNWVVEPVIQQAQQLFAGKTLKTYEYALILQIHKLKKAANITL